MVIWETEYDGLYAAPADLAIDGAGDVVVVGHEATATEYVGLVQRYGADGELEDSVTVPSPAPQVYTTMGGVCLGEGDRFYAVGSFDHVSGGPSTRHLRAYDGIDVAWTSDSDPNEIEFWVRCLVADDGPVAVGGERLGEYEIIRGVATAFDDDGEEIWTLVRESPDGVVFVDVAPTPAGDYVVGAQAPDFTLVWLGSDGTELADRPYPGYYLHRLATDADGSIYVAAAENATALPRIAKLDEDGDELWSANPLAEVVLSDDAGVYPYGGALAIGPAGQLVVGGDATEEGGVAQPWWATYSTDGEQLVFSFLDTNLPAGTPAGINALAAGDDGTLVVALYSWAGTPAMLVRKQVW
jgi:hypothetical protein